MTVEQLTNMLKDLPPQAEIVTWAPGIGFTSTDFSITKVTREDQCWIELCLEQAPC